jgi:hypothetical protein
MSDPTGEPRPLYYAESALSRATARRMRAARRSRFIRRAFMLTLLVGIPSGIFGVRYAYIQSCRPHLEQMLNLRLQPDDRLIDVQIDEWLDGHDYYKLRLTPASYKRLKELAPTDVKPVGSPSMLAAWPWDVPPDGIVVESDNGGYGQSFMFSPSSRTVYLYDWHH